MSFYGAAKRIVVHFQVEEFQEKVLDKFKKSKVLRINALHLVSKRACERQKIFRARVSNVVVQTLAEVGQ